MLLLLPLLELAILAAAPAPPALLPLLQEGRTLQMRGRARGQVLEPGRPVRPDVAYRFTDLQVVAVTATGFGLTEETFIHGAASDTYGALARPDRRRRSRLEVLRPHLEVRSSAVSEASRRGDHWGPESPLPPATDGFGLDDPAREAAGLFGLILPAELFARLAAGETVERHLDRSLPGGGHATGLTRLRADGREPFPLDLRVEVAPDRLLLGLPAPPDRRVELPALRVVVRGSYRLTRPGEPAWERTDAWDWMVLDRPHEPWILRREGTALRRSQDGGRQTEAFASVVLQRLVDREAPLDEAGSPP